MALFTSEITDIKQHELWQVCKWAMGRTGSTTPGHWDRTSWIKTFVFALFQLWHVKLSTRVICYFQTEFKHSTTKQLVYWLFLSLSLSLSLLHFSLYFPVIAASWKETIRGMQPVLEEEEEDGGVGETALWLAAQFLSHRSLSHSHYNKYTLWVIASRGSGESRFLCNG